ncbi:MAG: hypothetical protein ACKO37_09760 [Vampirovibrionales bacterium]
MVFSPSSEVLINKKALLAEVWRNVGTSLSQDSKSLKLAAAFWSTLIHVIGRCQVAVTSYVNAPPEDKAFTHRQSNEVLFRELVGFSVGWGLLKPFEKTIKQQVAKQTGYVVERPGTTGVGEGIAQTLHILQGKLTHVTRGPDVLTGEEIIRKTRLELDKRLLTLGAVLRDRYGLIAKSVVDPAQLERVAFKWAHDYIPIAVGTVPALALAGWWVERTTLVKGNKMMRQTAGKALDEAHEENHASAPVSPMMSSPSMVSATPMTTPPAPAVAPAFGASRPPQWKPVGYAVPLFR